MWVLYLRLPTACKYWTFERFLSRCASTMRVCILVCPGYTILILTLECKSPRLDYRPDMFIIRVFYIGMAHFWFVYKSFRLNICLAFESSLCSTLFQSCWQMEEFPGPTTWSRLKRVYHCFCQLVLSSTAYPWVYTDICVSLIANLRCQQFFY